MVDFTFSKNWIHAGVEYKPGDKAKFQPSVANMLQAAEAGKAATTPTTRRAAAETKED